MSSSSSSTSSSSGDFPIYGATYYNEFKDMNSINNPVIDNNVQMQFSGFWIEGDAVSTPTLNDFTKGLGKTRNNRGMIFSNKTSTLFSEYGGYIGMLLSFPFDIVDGVYRPLINDNADVNENILFGINMGRYEYTQPSLYAALTPRGIEFTIFTSEGEVTLVDTISNIGANESAFFEFAWGNLWFNDTVQRSQAVALMVNEEIISSLIFPIANDYLADLTLSVLDTPLNVSNLECSIKKLVIYNRIPNSLFERYEGSSSSD